MRIFKQVIKACIFIVLLIAVLCCADYLLVDDNTYTRIMLHEMYAQDDIDVVFLSGSIAYRHYDPEAFDKITGLRSFNCGSSSQRPVDSYHVMREVFKTHKPRYCIFSASYVSFLNLKDYSANIQTQILFDYMPLSLNKLSYAWGVYGVEQANAWIPFLREKIPEISQIVNVLSMKTGEDYLRYSYATVDYGSEKYAGRGFVTRDQKNTPGMIGGLSTYRYSRSAIDEEQLAYFLKLAKLCRENDCALIVADSPVPYFNMAFHEDYQQILDFYEELALAANAQWLPMDMAKPALFIPDDADYYDATHMNGAAAKRYSATMAEFFMQYIAGGADVPYEELFYADYRQLLAANQRVYSTWLSTGENGDYRAMSTKPADTSVEYRFSFRTDRDGEWTLLRDYSKNDMLTSEFLPAGAVELRVDARLVGSKDELQQSDILPVE